MKAIEVNGVTKQFGALKVLKDINLTVEKGEIFTLLGENGAGKSTLINILATLSAQDCGTVKILGLDPIKQGNQVRPLIALNAQDTTFDAEFSGLDNLKLIAKLRGIQNIPAAIDRVSRQLDLTEFLARKVKTYSGGMRRRLDLAMSLLGDAQVIFLDEPTTGVDPKNRLALWQMIEAIRDAGKTVFLTTQYLDEADALSDHIGFIRDGVIVKYGTPAEIKQRVTATYTITVDEQQVQLAQQLLNEAHIAFTNTNARFNLHADVAAKAMSLMLDHHINVLHYDRDEADLESVFLAINDQENNHAND
ncbi:ABC transporter ATP-binding protein [Lacticaseibacillus porcinae]|uniref:ABC transporter ATP-binding protein n=1 Tax=Lacticaseibacillus porcinae TaxID=1123687 RepID=UPI000F782D84|nr:ABC transporter ATP-binding protein [Lacticaseibacillus porcinae]